MRRALFIVAFVAIARAVFAETFYLRDPGGDALGVFQFEDGATVTLDGKPYTVVRPTATKRAFDAHMDAIRIPEVDFRDAGFREVVELLNTASLKAGSPTGAVHFLLDLRTNLTAGASEVAAVEQALPRITFSARHITLRELLHITVDVAGLTYVIRDGAVVIVPGDTPDGPILTRIYAMLPSIAVRINDWKEFFANLGMRWPRGSSIEYVPAIGKVVVANTVDNLTLFEGLIRGDDSTGFQVEIHAQVLAVPQSNVVARMKQDLSAEVLQGMLMAGRGRLLALPRVVTQSGLESTVTGVVLSPSGATPASTGTNAAASLLSAADSGFVFKCLPEMSPEGSMINMTVSLDIAVPAGSVAPHTGASGKRTSWGTETSVCIANGATLLMGGGVPTADGHDLLYLLVSARLVDTSGKPIKQGEPYLSPEE